MCVILKPPVSGKMFKVNLRKIISYRDSVEDLSATCPSRIVKAELCRM